MSTKKLFLMVGYPGSGKTTTAKLLHELTGAVHLWADHERRRMFAKPRYTHEENLALYKELNEKTDQLLGQGESVIFDTNFNFYKDRENLRKIAAKHGAAVMTVWLTTPVDVARRRATKDAHKQDTRVLGDIPHEQFERIVRNLEPPRAEEHVVTLDGSEISREKVAAALGIKA